MRVSEVFKRGYRRGGERVRAGGAEYGADGAL